jgi:hypothetical protein
MGENMLPWKSWRAPELAALSCAFLPRILAHEQHG